VTGTQVDRKRLTENKLSVTDTFMCYTWKTSK